MNKEVIINTKRKISYEIIEKDKQIVVFKDELYLNGILKTSIEGFCDYNKIKEIQNIENIEEIKYLSLFDRAFLQTLLKEDILTNKFLEKYNEYQIKNPYTYYIHNNKNFNENLLLFFNTSSYECYDLNNVYYPKRIHFDYIDGCISNEKYDLVKLLNYLKKQNNICFQDTPRILSIPGYNVINDCTDYLSFYFIPTKEEYNKIKEYDTYSKKIYILDNILKLDKFKIK